MTEATPGQALAHEAQASEARPWFLYLLFGLFGAQQGLLGPIMPFLRETLALDLSWAGLHFAAYAAGLALIGWPYRWLERRLRTTSMATVACASVIVASSLLALAGYWSLTLLAAGAMGLSGGFVMAVGQAALGERYREQAASRLVEAHIVAGLCVLGGALLVGGITGLGLSWRLVPASIAAVAVLLTLLALRRREAPSLQALANPLDHNRPPSMTRRLQASLWALVLLGIAAEWGVGFWGAEYLTVHAGVSASTAATLMSLYFAGTVCGRLASRYALSRVRPLLLLVGVMFGAIATLLVLFFSETRLLTALFIFVLGACLGNFFPLILGSAMQVAPGASSAISAQASQAVGVALLLAPFLLGLLSSRIGVEAAFNLLLVYPLLMLPIARGLHHPGVRP
ncbi:MFS transporter [Pseudomonas sp. NPDC089530]|uniref:MFS transporter n=1 Tax=Pseudomonas sp. NPDC089530 TaxID=3390651 RepID=UPI003D06335D